MAVVCGREREQERELARVRELERTAASVAERGDHLSRRWARAMEREHGEATASWGGLVRC